MTNEGPIETPTLVREDKSVERHSLVCLFVHSILVFVQFEGQRQSTGVFALMTSAMVSVARCRC